MNQITYRSVTVKKEVEVVTEDEDGNEVVEMQEIEETTLTVYLHHTTPEQMSAAYGFTEQQNEHLALLRHEEYSVMSVYSTHLDVYKRQHFIIRVDGIDE